MLTHQNFWVNYNSSQERHYDFIATSDRFFYWLDHYMINNAEHKLSWHLADVMNKLREDAPDMANAIRSHLSKLPYIYQCLQSGEGMRFPITVDGEKLVCGWGRTVIVSRYFPSVKMPTVVISDHVLESAERLLSINDLMRKILALDFWTDKDVSNTRFGFYILNHDQIMTYDYQNDQDTFEFKFCQLAGDRNHVWDHMVEILRSHPSITQHNSMQILDQIIQELVPGLDPILY